MKLSELKIGQSAIIKDIDANERFIDSLTDLGITVGSKLTVIGIAPLGDPMLLKVRGCSVAIRKSEAKKITVGGCDE